MHKRLTKKFFTGILCLILICAFSLQPIAVTEEMPASEQSSEAAEGGLTGYYFQQLTTAEARGIYNTLCDMRDSGKLLTGDYTVDLVEIGVLQNTHYDRNALTADFSAARDAFMLDNSAVFYVDFDKLSLSLTQKGSDYSITLGTGRESSYFRKGFNKYNVKAAVNKFEDEVQKIAGLASDKNAEKDKLFTAYSEIVNRVSYALEGDAQPENVDYVRTPYGALVCGESVCEGYARALKAVLDSLGFESVLVQGYYSNGDRAEPHMWNYVKAEDNRWYLLDSTMEDGISSQEPADKFFLNHGLAENVKYYQPDGVISLSELSFEFRYPDLAASEYVPLSNAFVSQVISDYSSRINYNGMGLAEAKAQGKYVICSYNGKTWYYYENYHRYVIYSMQGVDDAVAEDHNGYFVDIYKLPYFAATEILPPAEMDKSDLLGYITYTGDAADIQDKSKVDEAVELRKAAPVAVTKEPANSRLSGGTTYSVKVIYSEKLKLSNVASSAELVWINEISGASVSDFQWDGEKTVTFTLKTAVNYNFVTGYYFALKNLVGTESLQEPNAVGFNVINNPTFSCPKVPGDINKVFANTPALISDSNLADNQWLDSEGNPISEKLPNRLTLVAETLVGAERDQLLNGISKTETVLSAQTFNISLGLCHNQVAYVTGKRVKVFVPFPEGYNAQSNVSFKAYHFDKNGIAEEIDCITTETGIIMMCDSFSPFAVIATEKTESDRKVITLANGNGSIDTELLALAGGESATVNIKADEGYVIERILLNGVELQFGTNKEFSLELSYSMLADMGNSLEVSFAVDPEYTADIGLVGDINGDGRVSPVDYLLLKRHCLGSFKLSDDSYPRADMNSDISIGAIDYLLLKRNYLKASQSV